MSTYGQIITEIASALGNRNTLEDKKSIARSLNYGTIVTCMAHNVPELQKYTRVTIETGRSSVVLDIPDLLHIIAIHSEQTRARILLVNPHRWNLIFPSRFGDDVYMCRWGNSLRVKNMSPMGDSYYIDYLAYPQIYKVEAEPSMDDLEFPYKGIETAVISNALEYMWAFLEESSAHEGWTKVREKVSASLPVTMDMGMIERGIA